MIINVKVKIIHKKHLTTMVSVSAYLQCQFDLLLDAVPISGLFLVFFYHAVCTCRDESRRYDLSGQFVMPSRPEPPDEGEWTVKPDFLSLTGESWSAVYSVHHVGGWVGVPVCICGIVLCCCVV